MFPNKICLSKHRRTESVSSACRHQCTHRPRSAVRLHVAVAGVEVSTCRIKLAVLQTVHTTVHTRPHQVLTTVGGWHHNRLRRVNLLRVPATSGIEIVTAALGVWKIRDTAGWTPVTSDTGWLKTNISLIPLHPELCWESKEFREEICRGMVEKVGAECKD